MATIERIDPAYTAWTPSAAGLVTEDEGYIGRHRAPDLARHFSLRQLFYTARHRTR
jgi:hypothetical protein